MVSLQTVLKANAELGEGPSWIASIANLMWVNIIAGELHFFDPLSTADRVFALGEYIGFAVQSNLPDDFIVGLQHGIAKFNTSNLKITWLAQPESNLPGNRFNDGKCGPDGRLFAGTMAIDESPLAGSLYRLDADKSIHSVVKPVSISNGLAWSLDHQHLYYIDTPTRKIVAYQYREDGSLDNPKVAVEIPASEGWPDGMTIDHEGNLWVGMWHGAKVACFNPRNGKKVAELPLPALNITACTFGGESYDKLFITSAWKGMSDEERRIYPESGNIFEAEVGVHGFPASSFVG